MSGVKRGQGLKATYCDVCVCGTFVHVVVVRARVCVSACKMLGLSFLSSC